MVTRLHLPHAIVVRLHVRKATLLSSHRKRRSQKVYDQKPILVGRIFHLGRSHRCCPVRATGGSLPCGRYLLAPLNGNKEGNKCLMVLRVKPTPTWFPTNSLYTPMDNTPLHSISSVCHPWDICRLQPLQWRYQRVMKFQLLRKGIYIYQCNTHVFAFLREVMPSDRVYQDKKTW